MCAPLRQLRANGLAAQFSTGFRAKSGGESAFKKKRKEENGFVFFCRTRTSSPLEASGRGNHPRNVKSPGDTRQIGDDFQGLSDKDARSVAAQSRWRGENTSGLRLSVYGSRRKKREINYLER